MNLPLILLLLLLAIYFAVLPVLFRKAGFDAWKGYVPILQYFVFLKVIKRPWWWIILLLIPGVNLLMLIIMNVELAKAFGRRSTADQWLAGAVPWYKLIHMSFFDKDLSYTGPVDWTNKKKGMAREWGEAIVFAVIAASIIRTFVMEPYTIPTPSMEKSLLVGDYLFVSKMSYGPRSPITPVAFPFAHHTIPVINTKAYTEWFKMPYFRLPGWTDVERYDAVVFNFPHGDTVLAHPELMGFDYYDFLRNEAIEEAGGVETFSENPKKFYDIARQRLESGFCKKCIPGPVYSGLETGGLISRPLDKKENYIKRCVGLPGETISIHDRQVHINGEAVENPEDFELSYRLITNLGNLTEGHLRKIRKELELPYLRDISRIPGAPNVITTNLTSAQLAKAEKLSFVTEILPVRDTSKVVDPHLRVFPNDIRYDWTADEFGPLLIPGEGVTIPLDLDELPKYRCAIEVYEGNELKVRDGKIYINGEESDSYTFKMNYYFLMGDNRHNSLDSRFWGFVPEDHVVGKAVFIWLSKQNSKDHNESRIRWERMFRTVK